VKANQAEGEDLSDLGYAFAGFDSDSCGGQVLVHVGRNDLARPSRQAKIPLRLKGEKTN
jgi:hypothetical protein